MLRHRLEQANLEGTGTGAPSPTPAPTPTPSPTPAANSDVWYPEAHKSIVETKGWKTPGDALESYVNLEKLIGADKAGRTVVLPKDENDVEGRKAFYAKLGVPESADKYELPLPDGDSDELAKAAADWFHKAGVPKTAAQQITKAWNDHISGMVKAQEEAEKAQADTELAQLKSTWGPEEAAPQGQALRETKFKTVFRSELCPPARPAYLTGTSRSTTTTSFSSCSRSPRASAKPCRAVRKSARARPRSIKWARSKCRTSRVGSSRCRASMHRPTGAGCPRSMRICRSSSTRSTSCA
jgi:hypothetical protein